MRSYSSSAAGLQHEAKGGWKPIPPPPSPEADLITVALRSIPYRPREMLQPTHFPLVDRTVHLPNEILLASVIDFQIGYFSTKLFDGLISGTRGCCRALSFRVAATSVVPRLMRIGLGHSDSGLVASAEVVKFLTRRVAIGRVRTRQVANGRLLRELLCLLFLNDLRPERHHSSEAQSAPAYSTDTCKNDHAHPENADQIGMNKYSDAPSIFSKCLHCVSVSSAERAPNSCSCWLYRQFSERKSGEK